EILSYLPFSYSFSMIKDDVVDSALLKSKLCKLPIELMQISQKTIKKISSVGFKTINDIHKLPHHALQKRFGSESLEYLLKLFNQLADPRKHFTPAEFFQQRLEFNEVVHHRQGLLFPIKRLLENLVRFLHLQQKNVQSLKWKLFDSGKGNICFEVVFSNAGINYKNYLELTQLNLEQHKLKEPIEAIELLAEELSPLEAISQTLFEQVGEFCSNPHFINKIRAKLGNNSCQIIQPLSSHLPELCSINQDIIMEVKFNNSDKKGSYKNLNKQESNANNPTWLLTHPQPLSVNNGILQYNGKLTIISSAKKLTTHWWKKNTARNYYISEHESGGYYWVFYDLIKKHWFLHGIYG
ncbi:MAG: hypothetical protein KUG78_19070, partial [Kangiellaceae bacterium]|nr:hypothetical protein [Kangiellaceae bacterium]